MNRLPFALIACLAGGCAAPEPRPIDPEASEREFRSRSLADAGLEAYVETYRSRELPSFPPPAWDLESLTLAAFYYHPDLDVARAQLEGAAARGITAGALPNPTIGAGFHYNLDIARGVSPWTYFFSFSQPLEIGGKRRYRRERAGHLSEAARLNLAETAWRVYSRVRTALLQHLLAVRREEILRTSQDAHSERVRLLEERLAAGAASLPEVEMARQEAARPRLLYLESQSDVTESRRQLAAAVGVPDGALEGARFSWESLDAPPPLAALDPSAIRTAGLRDRVDLRRLLSEYEAAEAALRLEVARRYPDVNLGPGFEREEGESKPVLGISMALPLFDRNEGPIAEAEAHRKEVAARFVALQAEVIARIGSSLERYGIALSKLAESDRLRDLSLVTERAMEEAVDVGEEDMLELAGSRIRVVSSREVRLTALLEAQLALGDLEDALQRPLGEIPLPPLAASLSGPRGGDRVEGE